MYELIELLYNECKLTSELCELICEEKLKRYQRAQYVRCQKIIFDIWVFLWVFWPPVKNGIEIEKGQIDSYMGGVEREG